MSLLQRDAAKMIASRLEDAKKLGRGSIITIEIWPRGKKLAPGSSMVWTIKPRSVEDVRKLMGNNPLPTGVLAAMKPTKARAKRR